MSPEEICWKAAKWVEKRGHAKFVLMDESNGHICLLGAINLAMSGDPRQSGGDWRSPLRLLESVIQDAPSSGVAWNNDAERTPEDVIDVLVAAYLRVLD